MNRQGWLTLGLCLFLAVLSSGCACVDSCSTSSCDFAGCGCTQYCGATSQPVVNSIHEIEQATYQRIKHGHCARPSCGCGRCGGWGNREFFVDDCGSPCFGPFASIAMMFRNSLMSCGCGQLYVDEWVSDPPLCEDPCGGGCTARGECGAYCNECAPRGCNGGNTGCSGCSGGCSGGCTDLGCSAGAPIEPGCDFVETEPACGLADIGGGFDPDCGFTEPDCGIALGLDSGIALEPDCGIALEPDCGISSTGCSGGGCSGGGGCAATCGCGKSLCGKVGCGQVAKGVLNGTARTVGHKVEHFLGHRHYKWSQRGRTKTCKDCQQYETDIPGYRFDTPGKLKAQPSPTNTCNCSKCKAAKAARARGVAQNRQRESEVELVQYVNVGGHNVRQVRGARRSR